MSPSLSLLQILQAFAGALSANRGPLLADALYASTTPPMRLFGAWRHDCAASKPVEGTDQALLQPQHPK